MKQPHSSIAIAWIVVLLVGYVLSIGPAVSLFWHGMLPAKLVIILYKPLEPLVDVPDVGTVLISYVDWWNPLHPSRPTP